MHSFSKQWDKTSVGRRGSGVWVTWHTPISEGPWPLHLTRSNKKQCSGNRGSLQGCFSHPDILRPEQELTVQVGLLDVVHVGHSDVSFLSSAEAHQRKVLEELAANGAGSNLESDKPVC